MLLMQERCFAVNVEHADLHRHVETNGRSAVTAEADDDGYSALMLTINQLSIVQIVFSYRYYSLLPAEFYMASPTEAKKQKDTSSFVT